MKRIALAVVAAGLVGTAMPMPAAQAKPAVQNFGGFAANATATPLKIEIYEPTIPIPAEPQAELDLAYTQTESATGPNSSGRASWLWPGDPVGEGFKTFVEQLGLPPQLGAKGYPVQVNSQNPGDPGKQADEPFPGTVMRTTSSPKKTVAEAGYSPDGDVSDGGDKKKKSDPGTPTPPPVPSPGDLSGLGAAITGKTATADDSKAPALPPQLAALVDVGGTSSISKNVFGASTIKSTATSTISDLSLIGGMITIDSIKVNTEAASNGKNATTDAVAKIVGLAIAGNQFTIQRSGVTGAGKQAPIPGLPDDPAKALKALGVSFKLPKGTHQAKNGSGKSLVQGLQITIDTHQLRSKLDSVPFDNAINRIPDQAAEAKTVLGALAHVSPRIVITAGNAAVEASTVPKISFPDIAGTAAPLASAAGGGSSTSGSPGTAVGGAATGGVPTSTAPSGATSDGGASTNVATKNAAAGLPPLASIPGAFLIGGLLLASGLGFWLQKVGAFVIGGSGSCSHGLDTGVPDLRKA
jgi:hypothetical protein